MLAFLNDWRYYGLGQSEYKKCMGEAANANNIVSLVVKTICDLNIPHEKSEAAPYVTVSIGLHIAQCGASHSTDTLYDIADKALYTAKRSGHNRAVISNVH
jgi:PleD family two-component response regulator